MMGFDIAAEDPVAVVKEEEAQGLLGVALPAAAP